MEELLETHVERFNEGVRSGDFEPMLDLFTADAELVFEGVAVGPFRGREAIAKAYRDRPPDDEIDVLDRRGGDGELVAGYSWRREPEIRAGELRITPVGERIGRLVVSSDARPRS